MAHHDLLTTTFLTLLSCNSIFADPVSGDYIDPGNARHTLYNYPPGLPEKLAWDWKGDAVFFCHALALAEKYKDITMRYVMSVSPAVHALDLSCEPPSPLIHASKDHAHVEADYIYPNFDLDFEVNETIARSSQRLLGDFMYEKPMIFKSMSGEGDSWRAFGNTASILNITAGGFAVSTAQDDVSRCKRVNAIVADERNGIRGHRGRTCTLIEE